MSFEVRQKINGHTYVYEARNLWDKEQKKYVQKRVLIGKVDPKTKKVVPTRGKRKTLPRSSQSFGLVFFISKVIRRLKLDKTLRKVFKEEGYYLPMIYLAMYKAALENKPLYLFQDWIEENFIDNKNGLASQRISEILKILGDDIKGRDLFTKEWIQEHTPPKTSIMFDITSISSYSEETEWVEYGYNRDKEKLEQINLGIIYSQEKAVPLAYQVYPGSVPDVVTLKNLLQLIAKYDLDITSFVMDRGFYSRRNIEDLSKKRLNFIIPLKLETDTATELIAATEESICNASNAFSYNSYTYYHQKKSTKVGDARVVAHIFFDEQRQAREFDSFMQKLFHIQERFNEKKYKSKKQVDKHLDGMSSAKRKLFVLKKKCGVYHLALHNSNITKRKKAMGKFIILTNIKKLDASQILYLYRQKDQIEKIFMTLKDDLKEDRLRTKNNSCVHGKLFILFIALIVLSYIRHVAKQKGLLKTFTLNQIFYELRKLKIFTLSDHSLLMSELTKKQKSIFSAFNIKIPDSYSYNLTGF